jgi:mRNA degradation ribonuclease J1/J2
MLDGLTPYGKQLTCRVRSVLEELDEKDREILIAAIANSKTWQARTLENSLRERGITISDTSITRHRQGHCSCLKN